MAAAVGRASSQIKPKRRYDLDWLRVLAVLLLIYFHTAKIFDYPAFDYFDWHIKNNQVSARITVFTWFVHQWQMPLFFLLSGAGTWYSLLLRAPNKYLMERVKRLLIPLVFGTLVLVPPQVYLERLRTSGYQGTYWQFYPHFFECCYPNRNLSWHHLWFLAYLFVFSVIALPLLLYLRKDQHLIARLSERCERGVAIFLLAVPLVIIEVVLRARWPGWQNLIDDWANFCFYLTCFIYGYLIAADRRFGQTIDRHGTLALVLAVASATAIVAWDWSSSTALAYSPGYVLYQALRGFNTWFWLLAILSFGQKCLGFQHSILEYAKSAALPVYLLHQTVIVVIGFYVVQWNSEITEKFWFISTASLIMAIALYEILIRRTRVTRWLFGMKG